MKIYICIIVFVLFGYFSQGQCLVNSLTINTGYDPAIGIAVTPGTNGGIPVTDPHWILSAVSPGVATAITATVLTGLIEVVPGNKTDVIMGVGGWAINPIAYPGNWISCLNSNYYFTDGTGITVYEMTLGRPFRMCSNDSITLDFYIANDNYISSTNIDGTPLGFSQVPSIITTNFSIFTHFTQTVFLTSGPHIINIVVDNYNVPLPSNNPTGLDIYGSVFSASGLNSLVSEADTSCNTYVCSNTCNTLTMPDSLHLCSGSTVIMPATMSGSDSIISILWTPPTGLSDTSILNPTLTAGTSGWYYLTVKSILPVNLVFNGDFSLGDTGFTSSYPYVTGAGSLVPAGVFTITTDPHLEHSGAASFGDHTTGTGNMMAINGASTPISVWCQTIAVLPNTYYDFSAWFANWSSDTANNLPIIQFMVNGVLFGPTFNFPHPDGLWSQFASTWYSGTSTAATICIYDEQTAGFGNDFAIDDISFEQICIAEDSIYVDVIQRDTTHFGKDTSLCATTGGLTLYGPASDTAYSWNTGSTADSITVTVAGTYWVTAYGNCIVARDTFDVTFNPSPIVLLGNDTGFCIGDSLTLTSIQPAGSTFLWSTGSTSTSITVNTAGTYWLKVTNTNGCSATDTIDIVVSPHPVVNLGPDSTECGGNPIIIQSSFSYTSPTFLWSDGSSGSSLSVSATGTYWLQVTVGGCPGSDTINITILNDTLKLFNRDTAICLGASVQAIAIGNPLIRCQWIPTAGIANNTSPSPIISPDTSAMYVLTGVYPGCTNIVDSFYIDVQPKPYVFIGGRRSVCQDDTLHLEAIVSPAWYTHYTYNWVPTTNIDTSTPSVVVFRPGNFTNLILTVSTPAGCWGGDSAQIYINPNNFAFLDTNYTLCPGDSVQLRDSLVPGTIAAHVWHPGMYLNDSTSGTPWVHAITSMQYTAIVTNQYGCLDTVTAHVKILPSAVFYLCDSAVIYAGENYQINTQTNCTYFSWFPTYGLSDPNISNPIASPEINTKYIVYAKTEWGCMTHDSIDIYFDPGTILALPNAFTPGESINNILYILKRGQAILHYFRIFNRWGNKVFETSNIDEGWDGKYNGVPQPFDVYVFQIEAETSSGASFEKHGNITLIR
jgi:gliding motility-associated-like protein